MSDLLMARQLEELRHHLSHHDLNDQKNLDGWLAKVILQHHAAVANLKFKESERLRNLVRDEVAKERIRCGLARPT